jgi:carbon-monoxide dehydrogenase medium subunit
MFPSDFEYVAPTSIQEALDVLSRNPDAKVLAGGHSLLPLMKLRLASPPVLVDIGKIQELKGIRVNGAIGIGAYTTYHELERSQELAQRVPMLVECASNVGDPQVRNRGTIGGAIAHADPAADMTAVVLALGAEIKAVSANGERTIGVDNFFVDMLQSALEPGELLTEISIPQMTGRVGMAYEKFKHPASGYAIVGVAAVVLLGDNGTISACRIAVTGAGPKAQRATLAENMLRDRQPSADDIAAAAEQASSGLELIGDISASEEYRAHLTRVLTRRALTKALERIS